MATLKVYLTALERINRQQKVPATLMFVELGNKKSSNSYNNLMERNKAS